MNDRGIIFLYAVQVFVCFKKKTVTDLVKRGDTALVADRRSIFAAYLSIQLNFQTLLSIELVTSMNFHIIRLTLLTTTVTNHTLEGTPRKGRSTILSLFMKQRFRISSQYDRLTMSSDHFRKRLREKNHVVPIGRKRDSIGQDIRKLIEWYGMMVWYNFNRYSCIPPTEDSIPT